MAVATTVTFKTQSQLAQTYENSLQALNPGIIIQAPDGSAIASDWYVKQQVTASLGAGLSQDILIAQRNQFATTGAGSSLDELAAANNLPPRFSNFPAQGQVQVNTAVPFNITVPIGTILVNPANGVQYSVTDTATILSGTHGTINIRSVNTGNGLAAANGTRINPQTAVTGIDFFTVIFITDGFVQESDSSISNRIITASQNPRGGGSLGDFIGWAEEVQGVTGAYAFPYNLAGTRVIYTSALTGIFDADAILATSSIPYSRTAPASLVQQVALHIAQVQPANILQKVNTSATYQVPDIIDVEVLLVQGYTLSTIIPSIGLTVENLIKREVRRAIISAPLGGTNLINSSMVENSYILMSDIEQTLDLGLAASYTESGVYASLLIDRSVTTGSSSGQIVVPFGNNTLDTFGNSLICYDIVYANINVTLMVI
jgi:uncharacterized phage protein gp47/JayE